MSRVVDPTTVDLIDRICRFGRLPPGDVDRQNSYVEAPSPSQALGGETVELEAPRGGVKQTLVLRDSPNWIGVLAHNVAVGVISTILPATILPFMTIFLNMEGTQIVSARMLLALPWVLKPFFGIFTDCVPLVCGFHRRPYMVLGWLICAVALGSIYFIPIPDPFFRDRKLVGKPLGLLNATAVATINLDAPSHGAIYAMLMSVGTVGYVLADVAADGLTREVALEHFNEKPKEGGVFYLTVNRFRSMSMMGGSLFMAFCLSGVEYGSTFDFTLDYNTLMLICGIVSALPVPFILLFIDEKKRECRSFTLCMKQLWGIFQCRAVNSVIAFGFFSGVLGGMSVTALNPITYCWARVQPMNDNFGNVLGVGALLFGLAYVEKKGWIVNFRKIIIIANIVVLVVDFGATFITIWNIARSSWIWVGLPVVEVLHSGLEYAIFTDVISELSEPGTEAIMSSLVNAVSFLAVPFGIVLTKYIDSLFNLSNQDVMRDTTRVRTDSSITFIIAYVCQFLSIAWLFVLPNCAKDAREWKKRSSTSMTHAVVLLSLLTVCFCWTIAVHVLSVNLHENCWWKGMLEKKFLVRFCNCVATCHAMGGTSMRTFHLQDPQQPAPPSY